MNADDAEGLELLGKYMIYTCSPRLVFFPLSTSDLQQCVRSDCLPYRHVSYLTALPFTERTICDSKICSMHAYVMHESGVGRSHMRMI